MLKLQLTLLLQLNRCSSYAFCYKIENRVTPTRALMYLTWQKSIQCYFYASVTIVQVGLRMSPQGDTCVSRGRKPAESTGFQS